MGEFRYRNSDWKVTIDPFLLTKLISDNKHDMVDDASVEVDFHSDESVRIQIKREFDGEREDLPIAAIFINREGTFDACGNNEACMDFLQFVREDLRERTGYKVCLYAKSTSDQGYAEDVSVMGDVSVSD